MAFLNNFKGVNKGLAGNSTKNSESDFIFIPYLIFQF